MKVVHITTNDDGGAGSAVYKNHLSLLNSGVESKILVKNKTRNDNNVINYKEPVFFRIFNRIISKVVVPFFLMKEYFFFDLFYKKYKARVDWLNKHIPADTDVVIVGWCATFIELSDLIEIQKKINFSVYIHLVDMRYLTGGCHYSYGCREYTKACLICPGAANTLAQREVRDRFFLESLAIDALQAKVLAPIEFILNQAKESSKPFCGYLKTDLPVDKNVFCFKGKRNSPNEKVIFIGAYNPSDHRKGYLTLSNAIAFLNGKLALLGYKVQILVPNTNQFGNLVHSNVTLKTYSFASDDQSLAALYQMADVFVNTSVDDTGPAMPIEALMCGVPVICTNTGIAEELLANQHKFGRLVDAYDSEYIARALFDVLFSKSSQILPSENIEKLFKEKYLKHPSLAECIMQDLYE